MDIPTTIGIIALVVLVLAFIIPTVRDWLRVRALRQLTDYFASKKGVEVDPNFDSRKKVCYHSKKRGWRNGRQVGMDNSGRVIIEMIARDGGTYTVRRQPDLVYEGWRFKAIKDPMTPAEYAILEKRLAMAASHLDGFPN